MIDDSKFIHIPIEEATKPVHGATVIMNHWWAEYKEGHISVYVGNSRKNASGQYRTYSPQCNINEHISNRISKTQSVFLPVVFFVDRRAGE